MALTSLREAIRLGLKDPGPYNTLGQVVRWSAEGSKNAFAEAARIKKEKEAAQARMLQHKE